MSESAEQILLVNWFWLQYPQHMIFAIPNDQKMAYKARNPFAFKANMKKEGLLPGVSDLFIPVPTMIYSGLFLEMKDKKKTYCSVSKEQRQFIANMKHAGFAATWASGFDNAKVIIEMYLDGKVV